jgi:hypothetical protein
LAAISSSDGKQKNGGSFSGKQMQSAEKMDRACRAFSACSMRFIVREDSDSHDGGD